MNSLKIQLKGEEVHFLNNFVKNGLRKAREVYRANVLLLANKGKRDVEIAEILSISRQTVARVKKKYVKEGLESALKDKPRSGQPIKYDERKKAEIIALACSNPPEGRKRWTIRLLMGEMRDKEGFETINFESMRLILKKAGLNLG